MNEQQGAYSLTPPSSAQPARGFKTHVAWTLAARLFVMSGGLLSSIIVARKLGAEGLGALAVINVTIAIALQLGSAGLPSANTYFISRDRRMLAPVVANALLFGLLAGALLALMVAGLAWLRPTLFGGVPLRLLLIAAISIPFQLITFLSLNVFLGAGRIAWFNLFEALSQTLLLFNAALALMLLARGLDALVTFNTIASVIVCLAVGLMIGRIISAEQEREPFRLRLELLKSMARYGLKFHVAVVASLLIFRADLLIVNHFRGQAEAGSYSVASQMAMLLMLLPGVIATLLFPRVTQAGEHQSQLAMKAARHTAFIMLVICLLAAPLAFLLPFIYGREFADAPLQLLILLPGVYLVGVESVLVQYFSGTGLPVAIPLFWLATLAFNLLLNLLFVPSYGARAAAVSSTASYALIFLLVAYYFRRATRSSLAQTYVLRGFELTDLLRVRRKSSSGHEL